MNIPYDYRRETDERLRELEMYKAKMEEILPQLQRSIEGLTAATEALTNYSNRAKGAIWIIFGIATILTGIFEGLKVLVSFFQEHK